MRRHLGPFLSALLLVALLEACADDTSGGEANDPEASGGPASPMASPTASAAESATDNATGTGDGTVEFGLVDTITVTAAGGEVGETAVPLDDEAAVHSFVSQFTGGDLGDQVENAVAQTDVPAGQQLYGAVVAIGCDAPDQVAVSTTGPDVVVTALKVPSPKSECFAPMTTVALVLVPDREG